ncbi:transglutaminase N-terminal domain-containing protein [Nocardioides sp.]|uniref:transglutaminase family protein n=1 Tax=Nocardioides sp. TaxID=35761 RepID=UPI00351688EA
MTRQLRVVHHSIYRYGGPAATSYNQARLTPATTTEQIVVHSRLEISPKPWTFEYRDYFGTQVTAFELLDPHDTMTVAATSTVQVTRVGEIEARASWEELRTVAVADRWTEYLVLPPTVAPPADFVQRAQQIAADHALPGEAARDLCSFVVEEVEYVPGATAVDGTAATAWQQRAGVCQDVAHLVIGGLRAVGIPARYVSGYAHPDTDPELGASVASQPHAWVEWWDDGWRGFDPGEGRPVDDRYVEVAHGRDYHDVKPLSGIYAGARTSALEVAVEITAL